MEVAVVQAVVSGIIGGLITGIAAVAGIKVHLYYVRRDLDDHHQRIRALERKPA